MLLRFWILCIAWLLNWRTAVRIRIFGALNSDCDLWSAEFGLGPSIVFGRKLIVCFMYVEREILTKLRRRPFLFLSSIVFWSSNWGEDLSWTKRLFICRIWVFAKTSWVPLVYSLSLIFQYNVLERDLNFCENVFLMFIFDYGFLFFFVLAVKLKKLRKHNFDDDSGPTWQIFLHSH